MESTRSRLIGLLSTNEEQYISGQLLSKELNISRSAIWKHMKELEKDGYQIEGISRKGYRIIKTPDKLSENTIKWGLQTKWLGKTIIHKDTTPTTQQIAHQAAQDNTPHGTIIIANEQTMGKGRMNRPWYSTKYKGIWMSIILRPKILPHQAPQLTLLTATVLADVLSKHTHVQPQIKWPNDILIHHKKTAGILIEMQAEQDQIQYVVIGIGLNVNQSYEDIPSDIKGKATSLRIETKKNWDLNELVHRILETFEVTYTSYIEDGFSDVKQKWESYGYKMGDPIWVNTMQNRYEAIFHGIGEDGALLIEKDGGTKKLYSAEIEWNKEGEKNNVE